MIPSIRSWDGRWGYVSLTDPLSLFQVAHDLQQLVAVHAGVVEELVKGAGILVLLVAFRRRAPDVVSGAVLGAAVGVGFNLAESVDYMSGGNAGSHYWVRQSVGLLTSHVAFSALTGPGVAAALLTRIRAGAFSWRGGAARRDWQSRG